MWTKVDSKNRTLFTSKIWQWVRVGIYGRKCEHSESRYFKLYGTFRDIFLVNLRIAQTLRDLCPSAFLELRLMTCLLPSPPSQGLLLSTHVLSRMLWMDADRLLIQSAVLKSHQEVTRKYFPMSQFLLQCFDLCQKVGLLSIESDESDNLGRALGFLHFWLFVPSRERVKV